MLNDLDTRLLRRAIALAGAARTRGDRPFAAVIADQHGAAIDHRQRQR